mmetsp:Transcript_40560/g.130412  ORF Transcript_40560/g.130412 Transcript_40560/m.130412 type:complete len:733 (-) Transcript_40560:74-2272(-)
MGRQDDRDEDTDATSEVEIAVHFNALGRKFGTEPDKVALNLSREGAHMALNVAPGHICFFPEIDPGLIFRVESVKPWSAYLELRTVDRAPHNLSVQDLRLGGTLRVRVALHPLEECALSVLRMQRARPQAGIRMDSLLEAMNREFGSDCPPPSNDGRPPQWLDRSGIFDATYSEGRRDWLVRWDFALTLLERTAAVLVMPQKRQKVEGQTSLPIDELLGKLVEVSPQLLGAPCGDDALLRKWLQASPCFEVRGENVSVITEALEPGVDEGGGRSGGGPLAIGEDQQGGSRGSTAQCRHSGSPEGRPSRSTGGGGGSSGTPGHHGVGPASRSHARRGEAPGVEAVFGAGGGESSAVASRGVRGRRFGAAMKVLNELGRLNEESLKLSRDKRWLCAEDEPLDERRSRVGPLADVMFKIRIVADRLLDEVKVALREGAADASIGRMWQDGISQHAKHADELAHRLESAEGDAPQLMQWLTRARHGLRDFQQDVLDDLMEALSGVRDEGVGGGARQSSPPPGAVARGGGGGGAHRDDRGPPLRGSGGGDRSRARGEPGGRDRSRDRGEYRGGASGYAPWPSDGGGCGGSRNGRDHHRGGGEGGGGGAGGGSGGSRRPSPPMGRDAVGGSGGRPHGGLGRPSSRSSSGGRVPGGETSEVELGVEYMYEVKSSEGPWYLGTIHRLKRDGRYEGDLHGGGCSVHYPSIKRHEIRRARRQAAKRLASSRGDSRARRPMRR